MLKRIGHAAIKSTRTRVAPQSSLHSSARRLAAADSQSAAQSLRKTHNAPYASRTHTCGALLGSDVGHDVILTGWLAPKGKVSKKFSFYTIRDSSGGAQLVVDARVCGEDVFAAMRDTPGESTVLIQGSIRMRPDSQQRDVPSGQVEVVVKSFKLLNPATGDLPFKPFDSQNLANEDLRLRYRYLDLRREELTSNLRKRSEVAHVVRTTLREQGFTEVETPVLLNSSPEGAREFLVPTRVKQGTTGEAPNARSPHFYALSQSPQQPKQLLVTSGAVDRYYQFARCFRDEDGRKDRQPEFTQVDLEMAWVSWGKPGDAPLSPAAETSSPQTEWAIGGHEVRDVVEGVVRRIWADVQGVELEERFRVMTYDEAMDRYGSDKPDLRFGLEISNATASLPPSLQAELAGRGEIIEYLWIPCGSEFEPAAAEFQSDGTVESVRVTQSSHGDVPWWHNARVFKGLSEQSKTGLAVGAAFPGAEDGHLLLSRRSAKSEGGSTPLGRARVAILEEALRRGDVAPPVDPKFLWVTQFPLFTRADEDKEFLAHGRWSSSHHPFTAPMWEDIESMYAGKIEQVRGQHYDLVLNGVEIGGGSVRVHDPAMQEFIFSRILQLDEREKASFGHLLHALQCGAPPHGGFAFGLDRLMTILCNTKSIRDVIAFPKTASGTDLLFKSPSLSSPDVLAGYGLKPLQ